MIPGNLSASFLSFSSPGPVPTPTAKLPPVHSQPRICLKPHPAPALRSARFIRAIILNYIPAATRATVSRDCFNPDISQISLVRTVKEYRTHTFIFIIRDLRGFYRASAIRFHKEKWTVAHIIPTDNHLCAFSYSSRWRDNVKYHG